MDEIRLAALRRALAKGRSRRHLAQFLGALSLAGAAAWGASPATEAKKIRRKCKCGGCDRCDRRGRCKPVPDGSVCFPDGLCQAGVCIPNS